MGDRSSPDIDVGRICHVQRPASRFGADAVEEIQEYVLAPPLTPDNDVLLDDQFGDESDSSTSSDGQPMPLSVTAVPAGASVAPSVLPNTSTSAGSTSHESEGQDGVDAAGDHLPIPRPARTRANLTVLSQRYNLYFAAYQNKIYVYQPRKGPQILPPVSLIIRPPESWMGRLTGGVQDTQFPHQMNYMIVGDLGSLEILLVAFDDGDVVAYYTHHIVQAIEARRSPPHDVHATRTCRRPSPFFHENVGASAWGLAIHTRSRLVAVSSNLHEVTVFAFALRSKDKQAGEHVLPGPEPWVGHGLLALERHFRSRTRTWRIVLPSGTVDNMSPHNIPSIAFCDDVGGNADKVVAVDINGNVWFFDIWTVGSHATATLIKAVSDGHPTRNTGWSVLLLPNSSFKPARSNHAAMGLAPNQIVGLTESLEPQVKNCMWLDITAGLVHVEGIAGNPKSYLRRLYGNTYQFGAPLNHPPQAMTSFAPFHPVYTPLPPFVNVPHIMATAAPPPQVDPLASEDGSSEDEDAVDVDPLFDNGFLDGLEAFELRKPSDLTPEVSTHSFDPADEPELGFQLGLTIVPTMAKVSQPSTTTRLLEFARGSKLRERFTRHVDVAFGLPSHLAQNFSILKTTKRGAWLHSLDGKSASVVCHEVIPTHNHHKRSAAQTPWDQMPHLSERISMHHHIPELGLVVLGSMGGRVALLSLTRPPDRHIFAAGGSGWAPSLSFRGPPGRDNGVKVSRAFRVEAVLPRKSDEDRRLRPWCTLHGLAVSRVPDYRAEGLKLLPRDGGWRPKAWRLILHYLDHTILMYDICRHQEEGDLLIF